MPTSKLEEMAELFAEGSGFGDPEARRNAELRLQIALADQQRRTAARLNHLTMLLVVVGFLQVLILTLQLWR